MGSLSQNLLLEQSENEWMFCASLMSGCGKVASVECAWLTPESFRNERLGKYWGRVLEHGDEMRAANEVGVLNDLLMKAADVPLIHRYDEYARLIGNSVYLVSTVYGVQDIVRHITAGNIEDVRHGITAMAEDMPSTDRRAYTANEIVGEFAHTIQNGVPTIMTRIGALDGITGGIFPQELTVIASRPGMGKTQIALQIAKNVALGGKKALFFSLEMSRIQIWARLACPLAGYEWRDVRSGNVKKEALESIDYESRNLATRLGDNFLIQDDAYSVHDIHRVCAHHSPDLVIIDQLPDIAWHESEPERVWLGRACKYMKQHIARGLNVGLIVIHQLNRNTEGRDDKRPKLADLRNSGEVEQRADTVLMCYRTDYYHGRDNGQNVVPFEMWMRKARMGEQDSLAILEYDLKKQWFT